MYVVKCYPLRFRGFGITRQQIEFPVNSRILSVGLNRFGSEQGKACLWALIDKDSKEFCWVKIVMILDDIDSKDIGTYSFVGTVKDVVPFHVFYKRDRE